MLGSAQTPGLPPPAVGVEQGRKGAQSPDARVLREEPRAGHLGPCMVGRVVQCEGREPGSLDVWYRQPTPLAQEETGSVLLSNPFCFLLFP